MCNGPSTPVLLFCCLFACSTGILGTANYIVDGINEIGQKLFGRSSEESRLTFEQMVTNLVYMRSLFRHAKLNGMDMSQFAEWRDLTYELTSIHQLFEDRGGGDCNWRHDYKLYKAQKSIKQYQEYKANVVPFLEILAQSYYANCAAIMQKIVAKNFDADQNRLLRQLNQVIRKALGALTVRQPHEETTNKTGWLLQYHGQVDKALLGFLRRHAVFENNRFIKRAQFIKKFKLLLDKPCSIVWSKISPLADVIRGYPTPPEFLALLSPEAREWMEIDEVCAGLGIEAMANHLYDAHFVPSGSYLSWAREHVDPDQQSDAIDPTSSPIHAGNNAQ